MTIARRTAVAPAGVALAVVTIVGAGLLGTAGPATAASRAAAVPGPVVLIGTAGVTWEDVDAESPPFDRLVADGAVGSLAVRSVRAIACPADGWLAVSAGRRSADAPTVRDDDTGVYEPYCRPLTLTVDEPGGAASVPRWDVYSTQAQDGTFEAEPGLLGRTLAEAGLTAAAVGPGAAIALAVPTTQATDAAGDAALVPVAYPGTDPAREVEAALAAEPDLVVIDVGTVRDPQDLAPDEPEPTGDLARPVEQQAADVAERIAAVLAVLPPTATVYLASVADAGQQPHLQLLGAGGRQPDGGAYADALLWTSSTRQPGLAQTTDLLPSVLAALGVDLPPQAVGSALTTLPTGTTPERRLEHVLDLDLAAQAVRPIVPWFFNGLVIAQLVLYGLATLALRRDSGDLRRRRGTLRLLRGAAVVFASVPAATFLANLVPWWRADVPGLAATATVTAFVLPIAALALLGPWRNRLLGPLGVVGGLTAGVMALDVITGSRLVLSSLMGVQPLVAGRFYGFSNPGFALFATGSLLLAIALADALVRDGRRREAVVVVALIGAAATLIDGMPGLGSDFGGPPAIVPAFAVLALLVAGVRITWRRALAIAGGTVVVVVGLAVLDWRRPPAQRTHLGRFVQTVVDGGAWPVVARKAEQNGDILTSSPLSALVPVAVAFVALVLARPSAWGARPLQLAYDRSPVLRHGLIAFAVLVAIGFALNDSGTAVPAVAATVAIPLLIAVSAQALELAEEESASDPGSSAPPRPAPPATATEPRSGATPA